MLTGVDCFPPPGLEALLVYCFFQGMLCWSVLMTELMILTISSHAAHNADFAKNEDFM